MNFANEMKLIAKTIDNFYFIGYYYHIVNDKYQKREKFRQRDKVVGLAKLRDEAESGGSEMCNHAHLQERYIEEHVAEMQHDVHLRRLVANLPGKRTGMMRYVVSRLGTGLVMLGSRLEGVEQREKQAVSPMA